MIQLTLLAMPWHFIVMILTWISQPWDLWRKWRCNELFFLLIHWVVQLSDIVSTIIFFHSICVYRIHMSNLKIHFITYIIWCIHYINWNSLLWCNRLSLWFTWTVISWIYHDCLLILSIFFLFIKVISWNLLYGFKV